LQFIQVLVIDVIEIQLYVIVTVIRLLLLVIIVIIVIIVIFNYQEDKLRLVTTLQLPKASVCNRLIFSV